MGWPTSCLWCVCGCDGLFSARGRVYLCLSCELWCLPVDVFKGPGQPAVCGELRGMMSWAGRISQLFVVS